MQLDMMDIHLDASLSRKLGGKATIFGALELVTISKLLLFMYMLFNFIYLIACSCFMYFCASCGIYMLRCRMCQTCTYTYTNSELQLIHI